jgi:branched-chain amino acid transport system permease protein
LPRGITPGQVIGIVVFLILALFVAPAVLSAFWLKAALEMAIYSLVTLGLGLLVGRVGIYSLCQIPLVGAGAWFGLRFYYLFNESLPFPLLLIIAGLATAALGVVIGLPALRLSGLYLALVTLMAAGAATLVLINIKFPNGGDGFRGFNSRNPSSVDAIPRPSIATTDVAYFRYTVIVALIMFLVTAWHITGKPGRAWASIRQSELTAVAAGINTTLYKLWAFALSAAIAGVAGVLLAAASGVTVNQFPVQESILLLAVVLLGGVYNLWGAVVAAFFLRLLPRILDDLIGVPSEALLILFGLGVLFTLMLQPRGVVQDLANLGNAIRSRLPGGKPAEVGA